MHPFPGSSFDGPGKVLAHAFYPPLGDVHYDRDETWDIFHSAGKRSLYYVSLHEIGHSLGLTHSSDPTAVMFPTYRPSNGENGLAANDIKRITELYGLRNLIILLNYSQMQMN